MSGLDVWMGLCFVHKAQQRVSSGRPCACCAAGVGRSSVASSNHFKRHTQQPTCPLSLEHFLTAAHSTARKPWHASVRCHHAASALPVASVIGHSGVCHGQ